MKKEIYQYFDHNKDEVIFTYKCTSILEADKMFEKKLGFNPATKNYIGCSTIDSWITKILKIFKLK